MHTIDVNETETDIQALLTQLKEGGEDIIIAIRGKPEARLINYKSKSSTNSQETLFGKDLIDAMTGCGDGDMSTNEIMSLTRDD